MGELITLHQKVTPNNPKPSTYPCLKQSNTRAHTHTQTEMHTLTYALTHTQTEAHTHTHTPGC